MSGTTQHELGTYRGLRFGVTLDAYSRLDVYLEGATARGTRLAKNSTGPRAILNALDRLADAYAEQIDRTERDLTLSREQLGDYRDRIGKPFDHEATFTELSNLRNQLNTALTKSFESTADSPASTAELAEHIKRLLAAQTIESASRKSREQTAEITAEQPIAAGLKEHISKPEPAHEPSPQPGVSEPEVTRPPVPTEQTVVAKIQPQPSGFRDRVAAGPPRTAQLKLF